MVRSRRSKSCGYARVRKLSIKCRKLNSYLGTDLGLVRGKGNVNLFQSFDPFSGQGVAYLLKLVLRQS